MTTVQESIQDQINEISKQINTLDLNRETLTDQVNDLTRLFSTLQIMENSSGQRNLVKQAISEIEKNKRTNFPE